MNNKERKHLVKRILNNGLTPEEEKDLLEKKPLSAYMYQQWCLYENEDATTNEADRIRILNRIHEKIKEKERKPIPYYAIASTAAILLLLVLLSISFYNQDRKPLSIDRYIVTTGIQNMKTITLPDGSSVHLGPGTRLTYPESFQGKNREITLDGLAFFEVTQNKAQPFIVHTSHVDINVLGTSFEVFSYSSENKIETVLLKGSIQAVFDNKSKKEKEQITLLPNQKMIFDKNTKAVTKAHVDATKYTSWSKNGILSFENESLTMILPRLEQWYGRKIICRKDIAEKYRFTFKVRDESLERILFILGESSPIKYHKIDEANYELSLKK